MAFTVGALFVLIDLIAAAFAYDPFATLALVVIAVVAIAAASARSIKYTVLAKPRESARELVSAARGVQRARMRRKYDSQPEPGVPDAKPIGLHSTRDFKFEPPQAEAPSPDGLAAAPPQA
jgi:hypothetical protein